MPDTTKLEEYQKIDYIKIQTLLAERFNATRGELPPLNDIKARRYFDNGDHWQLGNGFIGQLPTGDAAEDRTEMLRRAFSPEDVISEVLDTHVQNVLGNDPTISIEGEDKTLEDVLTWFDKRDNTKVLGTALRAARREQASVLRAFIPSGMIDGEGRINAKDLAEALSKIWIRCEPIESGGVIVDDATATELGLCLYRIRIGQADVSLAEYAYLDALGRTVWGTASAHTAKLGAEVAEPLKLGGMLPIYQMNARAMITDSVCQAQRDINLSGTMLTRNNNLAGSRERLAVGVQPPGEWVEQGVDESGNKVMVFQPASMPTGPATFNFLQPESIKDDSGNITAYANPNIIFTDPVPIDTFIGTSEHWRRVIYAKAKMLHLLMSDNATASGKSRIEARKEFQSSLNESKQIVDAAGKWMISVALNIAAHFIGKPGAFVESKVEFQADVSTIELTSEENAEIRADYESGMIDLRTALELRGIKNVEEILERISEQNRLEFETE
ncbi:MAG: hypothetical protein ABIR33_09485 [Pyrinomonadaceae bacterium]